MTPPVWNPAAQRLVSHDANPLGHGFHNKRVVWHRSESAGGAGTARSIAEFVDHERKQYSQTIDIAGGQVALYPITTGARSLLNTTGGVGPNRDALICYQICLTGFTRDHDDIRKLLHDPEFARLIHWLDEWGIPRIDLSNPHRSREMWAKSGHTTHASAPDNDHTDGIPLGWLKDFPKKGEHHTATTAHAHTSGTKPPKDDEPHYTVLVIGRDGRRTPILNRDGDGWTIDPAHAKEHPHGRIRHENVGGAIGWARSEGLVVVKVLLCRPAQAHPDHRDRHPGTGRLTKNDNAHWPKDELLMKRLKAMAEDMGVELRVVSGYRPCGSPSDAVGASTQWGLWKLYKAGRGNLAAVPCTSNHGRSGNGQGAVDLDVVKDGKLISIGDYPGGNAALARAGLWLSVRNSSGRVLEQWHTSVKP